jgi:hypothetical protein
MSEIPRTSLAVTNLTPFAVRFTPVIQILNVQV